ncbi:DUF4351 domain-containing protein [Haliangium sp.]|uniref:DUF4351 domain-containing protein n=1 Tax=Haliangium sp. TaxID=2663208 RepID=UPI003D0B3446
MIVYYLWSVNRQATRDRLLDELEPVLGPEIKQTMLTYAQQLEQQGREQGQRAFLVRLLETRFGPLPEAALQRVDRADPDTLQEWGTRVLFAASLDEVFATAQP